MKDRMMDEIEDPLTGLCRFAAVGDRSPGLGFWGASLLWSPAGVGVGGCPFP
jgi:hypothetical protein